MTSTKIFLWLLDNVFFDILTYSKANVNTSQLYYIAILFFKSDWAIDHINLIKA
jgi:hypothetical protein